jgi:CRISPR-associated protein Csb2
MTHILVSVRFLDDRYHGLLDRGGPPEWPPSPFRLFQALVAGVARRGELDSPIGQSLGWLQKLDPPIIIAPKSKTGQAITRFVPNNDGDKKFDRQERLTAKHTEPTLFLLEPNQKPEVHYVWDFDADGDKHVDRVRDAARSLTTLGWGIDMAFADARTAAADDIQKLKGTRWYPKKRDWPFRGTLRTPTYDDQIGECTLCDLRHCHSTFVNRIEHGKPLKTVDKPKIFDRVLYTSKERPIGRPYAVFKLVEGNKNAENMPYRYPHAKFIHIAGMVRHAAIELMKKDPPPGRQNDPTWLETFVCGHRGDGELPHEQLSFVPLPSIGHQHADAMIRNIMIIAPLGRDRDLEHVAQRLDGTELSAEGSADYCARQSAFPPTSHISLELFKPRPGKFIDKCYLGNSHTWQSVTPLILDGFNRKSKAEKPEVVAARTERLIKRALARAGVEAPCEFEWQAVPFFKNTLSAHKYDRNGHHTGYHRPAHLRAQTAVHVRIHFGRGEIPDNMDSRWMPLEPPFPGPLTLGAGRHCGFGLMAAVT